MIQMQDRILVLQEGPTKTLASDRGLSVVLTGMAAIAQVTRSLRHHGEDRTCFISVHRTGRSERPPVILLRQPAAPTTRIVCGQTSLPKIACEDGPIPGEHFSGASRLLLGMPRQTDVEGRLT